MTPDAVAAVQAYLAGEAVVTAEIPAERIFGEQLPAVETNDMPREALVVQAAGGGGIGSDSDLRLDVQRVDLNHYGRTPFMARRAARATHQAMKLLRRRVVTYNDEDGNPVSVLLHSATGSGGFVSVREPTTEWPRTLRSYSVLYAEEAVA